jgi:hypothetical protein
LRDLSATAFDRPNTRFYIDRVFNFTNYINFPVLCLQLNTDPPSALHKAVGSSLFSFVAHHFFISKSSPPEIPGIW